MHDRTSELTRRRPPVVLVCSGLDPSGGAGLLLDAAFVRAAGAHAAGLATCLTRQTPRGVFGMTPVPSRTIRDDLRALVRDLPIDAIKVGLVGAPATARVLADAARRTRAPLVLDPVLAASTGFPFANSAVLRALTEDLFPVAALVTPNRGEAAALAGHPIDSVDDAVDAARRLLDLGPRAVLVKGLPARGRRVDVLVERSRPPRLFSAREIAGADPHGTGCALASAVAARLGAGDSLPDAIRAARRLLLAAMRRRFAPAPRGLEFLSPVARRP